MEAEPTELELIAPLLAQIGRKLKLTSFGTYAASPAFPDLERKNKNRKIADVSKVLDLICQYAAPGYPKTLRKCVEKPNSNVDADSKEFMFKVMDKIKDIYYENKSPRVRRTALSLVSEHFNYSTVAHFIPELSKSMYHHSHQYDPLQGPVSTAPVIRERNRAKVEFFVKFLCRPEIMSDLPRGQYDVRLSDNTTIQIGAMLKHYSNSNIIKLYEKFLMDNQIDDMFMATSTYYKILNAIPSRKTSMNACVDYFFANGEEGFTNLQNILTKLKSNANSNQPRLDELSVALKKSRMFLVGEFRQSLQLVSSTYDFNVKFALSDPKDNDYRDASLTPPLYRSSKVLQLEIQIAEVAELLNANINNLSIFNAHEKEQFLSQILWAQQYIPDLITHYIRSSYSAQRKLMILQQLKTNEALLTIDFAQKILPIYYLETQAVSQNLN